MNNKYQLLSRFLLAVPEGTMECTLGFSDIEKLTGQALPSSALSHRAWWANQTRLDNRPQARAWKSAGFMVDAVNQGEGGWVRFKRSTVGAAPPAQANDQKQTSFVQRSGRLEVCKDTQESVRYDAGAIALVSCVASKRPAKSAARDLYASAWFKKVRQHVETAGLSWYILSAKYGLLHPDQQIESYEMTLNNMSVRERQAWAQSVMRQIGDQLQGRDNFVLFAGLRYREFLQPLLESEAAKIRVPMAGLTQGRQLNWLDSYQANVQA